MAADYTQAEILNELSKIFRTGISPGREGGTLNTRVEYGQLMDLAALTFLLQNDAIFYLAKIVRNTLNSLVVQEIRLLEDTLLSLDHLGKIGQPVRDTTILSNANTALLSLDAAGSVQDRPESARFSKQMDRFANLNRNNIVEANELVRPKEEARGVIEANLASLKKVHAKLLDSTYALRDLLDEYIDLDIPSKVSATAISNIRNNLEAIQEEIPDNENAANIAASRKNVLTALASKVAVDAIASFSDPRTVKVRSPSNSYPSYLKHYGRVTGSGTPALVTSTPGPWVLPLSAPLVLAVDGGVNVQVDVDEILGTALRATAEEDFGVSATQNNLHMVVDSRFFSGVVGTGTVSSAQLPSYLGLTFKNLGAPVSFPNMPTAGDEQPRAIFDLTLLQQGTLSGAPVNLGGERYRVTFSGWSGSAEAGSGLAQTHVGSYFLSTATYSRWEILVVEDANNAIISVPTRSPSVVPPASGTLQLRGDTAAASPHSIAFTPSTSAVTTGQNFSIGPAVKTLEIPVAPNNDVAGVISAAQSGAGDVDTSLSYNTWREMQLNAHVQILSDALNPGRLVFVPRSQRTPHLTVGASFLKILSTVGFTVVNDSAHEILGLLIGQSMVESRLAPQDLAELVESSVAGLSSSVNREVIANGSLTTVQGTAQVTAPELNGVALVGDRLTLGGVETGTFSIESLSPITLDRGAFASTQSGVPYRLVRTTVTLASSNSSRGSSLKVVSGPSGLGFPVGLVYGSVPYFEAIDRSGNLASFTDLADEGDVLSVVGGDDVAIDNVNSTTLELAAGLPSNTERVAFEIQSSSAVAYSELVEDLETFTNSSQLLKKHGFDVDLDDLDVALTRALLPGQNFLASRNQAKLITADLLSIMTAEPRRSEEYSTNVPTAAMNLEEILGSFAPASVPEIDSLIDTFLERKYARAAKLLQSGKIQEFFATDEETGSYAGSLMSAARDVVRDFPAQASTVEEVNNEVNLAATTSFNVDPEYVLDDSEVINAGRTRR